MISHTHYAALRKHSHLCARFSLRPIFRSVLLVLSVLSLSSTVFAQSGQDDFGAEQIVGNPNNELLPLSVVEEKDIVVEREKDAQSQEEELVELPPSPPKANFSAKALAELAELPLEEVPANDTSSAGVRIQSLDQQSTLAALGLADGDVIRSLNGVSTESKKKFREILAQGIELKNSVAVVTRDGQEVVIPLVFAADIDDEGAQNSDESQETTTILNVSDVDIAALVKTFSKLTKRNYIVDSTVKGTVTIHLPTPVTITESLRILDTVLLLKGFTTVPVGDRTWKVVSAKDARQTTIPLVTDIDSADSDVMVTKMVRLKYIMAEDLQKLLSQFVSKDGLINAFEGTNSLIIVDSAQNIYRLEDLVAELDVPAIDQEMSIIPILHADASDLSDKINEILGEEKEEQDALSVSNNITAARRAAINRRLQQNANNAASNSSDTPSSIRGRSLGFKIIPDERTNSIIVVADEEMTVRVKALVEQLDSELDRSGGRFYVYRLQHADSEELAEILNNLLNGSTGSSSTSEDGTQGSSLSRRRSTSSTSSGSNENQARLTRALQRSRDLLRRRAAGEDAVDGEGRVNLEGEVSIAPDPATNSLVINASRADYAKVSDVIALLDVKRRQVIVEATIMEVTLTDEQGMGVELQGTAAFNEGGGIAQTNYGGLTNLLTNPAALTDLTIAAASSGTVTLPGGITIPSQAVLISAVSRMSNVNVLSAPTIMATDNQEAEIIVGQNVPFVTSTSTDTANINNTFNTIERQDVGITLRITPQISTGDFVVLNIFVEISDVVAGTTNDPNGPTTTIRTTETSVTVKDGQMVVTGGLIQDSVTDSTRGVPFLQDIPVLGNLFKRQNSTIDKTNLLVLITPRVIKDQFDARLATKEKNEIVQEHIQRHGLNPDRSEIFNSEAIDRVAESYDGQENLAPSTITPPRSRTVTSQGIELSKENNEIVELNVAPTLPGLKNSPNRSTMRTVAKERNAQAPNGARTYAVLRPLVNGAPKLQIVELPSTNDSASAQHFQVGTVYKEHDADSAQSFVCIGRYGSLQEAKTMHEALSSADVKRLTPQELVELGSQAWLPTHPSTE